jgi:hypothetical protein
MGDAIQAGDVLICAALDGQVDVLDAASQRRLARFPSYTEAFDFALERPGAVWQQDADQTDGSAPILLFPKGHQARPRRSGPTS